MAPPAASTQIFGCRRANVHCGIVIINNSRDQCLRVCRGGLLFSVQRGILWDKLVRWQVGIYTVPSVSEDPLTHRHCFCRPVTYTLARLWGNQSRIYGSSAQCVTACSAYIMYIHLSAYIRFQDSERNTDIYIYIIYIGTLVYILYGRMALEKCKALKGRKTRDFRFTPFRFFSIVYV